MRLFSSRKLTVARKSGTGPAVYALSGFGPELPRGYYRLSATFHTLPAESAVALHYRPSRDQDRAEIRGLLLKLRSPGLGCEFALLEPVCELWLEGEDGRLLEQASELAIRRVSTSFLRGMRIAAAVARRAARPSGIRELAAKAVVAYRNGGIGNVFRVGERGALNDYLAADSVSAYRDWARIQEKTIDAANTSNGNAARLLKSQPVIAVIMPVHKPQAGHLVQAIESVIAQHWPHWQLCICDDASTDPEIAGIISRYRAADPRVRATALENRAGISAASNAALGLTNAEWIAFLDHDDRLSADALFQLAKTIDARPDAGLIYSDEDKLDAAGARCRPNFKPDWNLEIFRSYNMVNHLACYRRQLVEAAGGLRLAFDGAQDYDLALRICEKLDENRIVHIRQILYHWRMAPGSTALGPAAKPSALEAGRRALEEHLGRTGTAGRAALHAGTYRVSYATPQPPPLASIIVPTRDRLPLLSACLASIRAKTTYGNYEIVVADNDSSEAETLRWLDQQEAAGVIRLLRVPGPFNYSALNNQGAEMARSEFLALLNNDVEILSPDWLSEMIGTCLQPGVGAVGAKLYFPGGEIQHAGIILNPESVAGHWFKNYPGDHGGSGQRLKVRQRLSAVTGACLLTPKRLYRELGGLDEANLPVAFNDIDYCLKAAKAGYRVVFTPFAELIHHASASRGPDTNLEKFARLDKEAAFMKRKWGALLDGDPWGMPGLPPELGAKGWMA